MRLHESGENYLETILRLQSQQASVRSTDVAAALGYSKPSVSRAIGILRQEGYVVFAAGGRLELTQAGRDKAEDIYRRHVAITRLLVETLGVSPQAAEKDACRIEHVISRECSDKIQAFVEDAAL